MLKKTFSAAILLLLMCSMLSACNKKESVVGVWEDDSGEVTIFTANNELYNPVYDYEMGEYTQNEKTLVIKSQGEQRIIDYEIDGTVMLLSYNDEDGNLQSARYLKISSDYEEYLQKTHIETDTDSEQHDTDYTENTEENSEEMIINDAIAQLAAAEYDYTCSYKTSQNIDEKEYETIVDILNRRFAIAGVLAYAYVEDSTINIDFIDQQILVSSLMSQGTFLVNDTNENVIINNEYLKNVQCMESIDDSGYIIEITLNDAGAKIFEEKTGELIGQALNISINDLVVSSPVVNETVTEGKFIVPAGEEQEEAAQIAAVLKSGVLPCEIEEVSIIEKD